MCSGIETGGKSVEGTGMEYYWEQAVVSASTHGREGRSFTLGVYMMAGSEEGFAVKAKVLL